ncbi:MAG: hypothetical protein DMD81_25615 [Candidatus Rokuibacteriota bacterium]|nr:MAG: hypothetical protein DMD81_25615 [Candidatus Rokubacteria bacterium]
MTAGCNRKSALTTGWARCSSSIRNWLASKSGMPWLASPTRWVLFASTTAHMATRAPAWVDSHSTARSAHSATSFVTSRNSRRWSRSSFDARGARLVCGTAATRDTG